MQVPGPFEYERATSVDHAIGLLDRLAENARIVAGGRDQGFCQTREEPRVFRRVRRPVFGAAVEAVTKPVAFLATDIQGRQPWVRMRCQYSGRCDRRRTRWDGV
jgi:hypothetical protein